MSDSQQQYTIPIVDLGDLGLGCPKTPSEEEWGRVASQLIKAFEDIGFVYLRKHGLPQKIIDQVQENADKFFALPQDTKKLFKRGSDNHGFVAVDQERLDIKSRREIRESFNVTKRDGLYPIEEIPSFRASVMSLIERCTELCFTLLRAMALGLGLEKEFFVRTHQGMFNGDNYTTLRLLHYPPIPADVGAGDIRCGAHADYGTLTLLFQDDMGGLQVQTRSGDWADAHPIPGAILVNVGELLQFWTSDRLTGTVHRVVIPEEEVKQRASRRSAAFFLHPDDSVLIRPFGGSVSFQQLTAKQRTDSHFQETYQFQ